MTAMSPATASLDPAVVWHDLECGGYRADLPLWRELAAASGGPVLDIGAGTGRVAIDLARQGTSVIALDVDPVLLGECARRARGLPVLTVLGDARELALQTPALELCLVPMQTVQLLDPAGRVALLRAARARTRPGGLLACALVDELQLFDESLHVLPTPDEIRLGDVTYSSQPTAVRAVGEYFVLERRREISHGGHHSVQQDVIRLHRVSPDAFEREARAAGWQPEPRGQIPDTVDHVGSTVVMLRG